MTEKGKIVYRVHFVDGTESLFWGNVCTLGDNICSISGGEEKVRINWTRVLYMTEEVYVKKEEHESRQGTATQSGDTPEGGRAV